jgi:CheY-like chemotaxis protein
MTESALYLAGQSASGISPDLQEHSRKTPAATTNNSHQVLLVEDSRAEAEIFQKALELASTRVRAYWVASGGEALEFLEQKGRFSGVSPIRIVVLDLNLPDLTGFEVLQRIRADPSNNRYVTVVFSSSTNRRDIDAAYAFGANAYFAKPMSMELYVAKVRVLIEYWLDLAELPG